MTESSGDQQPLPSKIRGLYLILDHQWASRQAFPNILRSAAEYGVSVVQYRNKTEGMNEVFRHALGLRKIARECGLVFIVNDRCDLGLAVEADGVHLGQSDLPIGLARELLGDHCLIGMSTHTPEQVVEATRQGADYIGFGPLFPTETKADREAVVGLDGLKRVRPLASIPLVAIGGIHSDTVSEIVAAGADAVAAASGILDSTDPRQAIRLYMESFQ